MSNKTLVKAYKYRIYPSNSQIKQFAYHNELLRNLYNSALEHRITSYKKHNISISLYDQLNELPEIIKDNPEYKSIHSQVLQNCLKRVDDAFQRFFDRCKSRKPNEKVGFPRFKKFNSYKSFTFPQSGFSIIEKLDNKKGKKHQHKLKLSKLGEVKISFHRDILGKIKTCTIKKEKTGKWFVSLVAECSEIPLDKTGKNIGLDRNLLNYLTDDQGNVIENPRFAKQEQKELAKVNRKLSKTEKKSAERDKRKKIVQRVNERIVNKRENFAHQESAKLVKENDVLCIEKLSVKKMMENAEHSNISRSIADVSWSRFALNMIYKAENAGRLLVQINPAYTSQMCSKCFKLKEMALDERIYRCERASCMNVMDRDQNAAVNILRLGLQSVNLEL